VWGGGGAEGDVEGGEGVDMQRFANLQTAQMGEQHNGDRDRHVRTPSAYS